MSCILLVSDYLANICAWKARSDVSDWCASDFVVLPDIKFHPNRPHVCVVNIYRAITKTRNGKKQFLLCFRNGNFSKCSLFLMVLLKMASVVADVCLISLSFWQMSVTYADAVMTLLEQAMVKMRTNHRSPPRRSYRTSNTRWRFAFFAPSSVPWIKGNTVV